MDKSSISSLYESQERKIDTMISQQESLNSRAISSQQHNNFLKHVNHVY